MNRHNEKLQRKLVALRRELHRFPELSWQECDTSKRICAALDALGIAYRTGVARYGIIAEIPGAVKGPAIALRADMDALPIREETGLEFASQNEGAMHACGHDGHMTILLGAAELLLREEHLPYPVRLIFQPAEEVAQGAKGMIEEGALDGVAMIFGGHLDRHYSTGSIVVSEGAVNASTDTFDIDIGGQGAHGARPHESTDAVVVGSLMVMAIQTLVSREVDPAHPSVVSVGEFRAGTAPNVIAGQATLRGTVRSQHEIVREQLLTGIERIARSIGELHGAEVRVTIHPGTPALINTPEMAQLAREAATTVVGADNVLKLRQANMGGEDFSYFLDKAPGCYVRYGAQLVGREGYPAHSSKFDFDEPALLIGAEYLCAIALAAMRRLANGAG